jgi:Carboxypeptidase regulatory-like domain
MRSTIQRTFMLRRWFVVMVIAASNFVQAQSPTATITGTVTDTSGAVIPQAKITLQTASGPVQQTKVDTAGRFTMVVGSGEYSLNISAWGFEPFSQLISLAAATTLTKPVVLSISSMDYCGPCVNLVLIELETPNPLTATLSLQPLPPLKSHSGNSKNRLQ